MSTAHTIVLSDLHLTEVEPVDPRRPLWKRHKHADLGFDGSFGRLLRHLAEEIGGPYELVLNGDIFDFDAIMEVPKRAFATSWLERRRGLAPEEPKSAWKMELILRHHPEWFAALREAIAAGCEVVFVIGNHDMELHWPAVQRVVLDALHDPEGARVRFCAWFYLSGSDTLVEHGNQYDRYCTCQDPVSPLVGPLQRPRVRLPFGNLAGKLMTNGMGLFNPHVESSFIKSSLSEYLVFFYRYVVRVQPFLLWTWAWGALATLVVSLREGFLPAHRDPFALEGRMDGIARVARSKPSVVRSLRALHVHPATFSPWMVARELWLDRAALLAVVFWGSFQLYSVVNLFQRVPFWWFALFFAALLPPFLFYARSVGSQVAVMNRAMLRAVPAAAVLTGARRVVVGHTHRESHTSVEGFELLNTGTWSPVFEDPAGLVARGRRCFAWIRPGGDRRVAALWEWLDPGLRQLERKGATSGRSRLRDRLRDRLSVLPRAGGVPPGGTDLSPEGDEARGSGTVLRTADSGCAPS